jgi:cephalosporin hydroxylase
VYTRNLILLIALAGPGALFAQSGATDQSLECVGVDSSSGFSLRTVPVAKAFEKLVLMTPTGDQREYLVEGSRKIPLKNESALFGSLLSNHPANGEYELILEPESHIEMYRSQAKIKSPGSENTILIFDHTNPVQERLDLKTGQRARNESRSMGRITLNCNRFPEYLRHIELAGSGTDGDSTVWRRTIASRMKDLGDKFLSAYIDNNLVFENRFLGVETWQNPFDMWIFQQLISELKPDLIIETGTAHGGSALFFATILEKVNPHGRVVTVEIDPEVEHNTRLARRYPVFNERVKIVRGDSVSSRTLDEIRQYFQELQSQRIDASDASDEAQLRVLVTLDSLHSAEHVARELQLYSQFVSSGGYIVVQDTVIDHNPRMLDWFVRPWSIDPAGGPELAVEQFLTANPAFYRERKWEKYYFTFYPGGFLRKSE